MLSMLQIYVFPINLRGANLRADDRPMLHSEPINLVESSSMKWPNNEKPGGTMSLANGCNDDGDTMQ